MISTLFPAKHGKRLGVLETTGDDDYESEGFLITINEFGVKNYKG
jgi:hypothetical protein